MKLLWILGIVCAALVHVAILAFGGILFAKDKGEHARLQEVELLDGKEPVKPDEPKPEPEEEREKLATQEDAPPDATQILHDLEQPAANDAPALEAASLGSIEAALSGAAGGGDFGAAFSFASGGRIGGTGRAGALEQKLESAFNLSEIDQKPRPIVQNSPLYPGEMRGKKVEGLVNVIFVVDAAGKVVNPRIEKSSHPAFERPALDAVKQWKFEPAVKGGQRVPCKMRAPIRFPPG